LDTLLHDSLYHLKRCTRSGIQARVKNVRINYSANTITSSFSLLYY
jgi:hypothetical protein